MSSLPREKVVPRCGPVRGALQGVGAFSLQTVKTNSISLLNLIGTERYIQAQTLTGRVSGNAALGVSFGNKLFATGVNEQAYEVGAHIVAREVSKSFRKVTFVQVNLS